MSDVTGGLNSGFLSRGVDNANALVLIQRLGRTHSASPIHIASGHSVVLNRGIAGREPVVFGDSLVGLAQG
ncbi:protein of unknown function [Hyphomicrobium sp. 1Nfss2.1]